MSDRILPPLRRTASDAERFARVAETTFYVALAAFFLTAAGFLIYANGQSSVKRSTYVRFYPIEGDPVMGHSMGPYFGECLKRPDGFYCAQEKDSGETPKPRATSEQSDVRPIPKGWYDWADAADRPVAPAAMAAFYTGARSFGRVGFEGEFSADGRTFIVVKAPDGYRDTIGHRFISKARNCLNCAD